MGVISRLAAGVTAGVAGTLAMDLLWYARYREGGGQDQFSTWEFNTSVDSFEDAAAPGKVAARLADAAGIDLPDRSAGTAANAVHWLTGAGYGVAHAILNGRRGAVRGGLRTGVLAFGTSYATLGAMGIYEPLWEYDAETLGKDASAHLLLGVATGIVYGILRFGDD